jgi:hypothetical protein
MSYTIHIHPGSKSGKVGKETTTTK